LSDSGQTLNDTGRELNRLEILRGMRLSTWDGAFATIHTSLTAGAFLTGFALWLGANDLALGLLTAIPTFAGLIQVLASYFGEREGPRKPFVAWLALAARVLWLPMLMLPFLLPRSVAMAAFLPLYAISFCLLNLTVPAWTSWMSDLVPADHRGRYFAQRNTVAGIAGMLIGLPAAWFLDMATRKHHWEAVAFAILFGVGVLGGIASFLAIMRQPEPRPKVSESARTGGLRGILDFYRAPFADRNFRSLLIFNMVFVTGQFFAAPFYTVWALKNLHLNYVWLQVFGTLTSLAGLGSMALWGYLADKFGNKPLLAIGVVGVFFLPVGWTLTSADRPHLTLLIIAAINLAGGMFWAGVGLTQFNLLIRLSPPGRTGVYVATMAALTGLTGGLAPLVGGVVMHALEGWHTQLPGLTLLNFQVVFMISAALRIAGLLFLAPVVDASSVSTIDVLQQLSEARPRAWRDIRRLRGASDEETRLRATAALANSKTRLAVSELIAALRDPSLAVREEAAHALGEIGDPIAAPVLVEVLRDPAQGIAGEAARALGRIGDRASTSAIVEMLCDRSDRYSREDRILAIRALGAMGGSDAAAALLHTLEETGHSAEEHEEEHEAIARALGLIGDPRAAPVLAHWLQREGAPRPLRLAIVRALGELGHPSAIAVLRETLAESLEDSILFPLLADALARLGDTGSIRTLIEGIGRQSSPVGRRQAANAVGTLLGQGELLYSLLAHEDFARDAAITRLAEELQKSTRGIAGASDIPGALEAYVLEDYGKCATMLAAIGQSVHSEPSTSHAASATQCNEVIQAIAAFGPKPIPVELALIAWCALRGAVDG